ncbi:hypothetical protein FB446DRAFT_830189 [Lentinula raphanica]|nr:hypothetical protein FB446DRAFT_830189 [Lentinula raphanica]
MPTPRSHFRSPLCVVTTIFKCSWITHQVFLQKLYSILWGYRVWDPRCRGVYPVRDVEFEEGIPRRTLQDPTTVTENGIDFNTGTDSADCSEDPSSSTEDPVDYTQMTSSEPSASFPPSNTSTSNSLPPSSPPDSLSSPTPLSTSVTGRPSMSPDPPVLCRSSRNRVPSARLLQSMEYEQDANRARKDAEQWANIIVLASTIKGGGDVGIPKSYGDAMKNSEDWLPPMQKEHHILPDFCKRFR